MEYRIYGIRSELTDLDCCRDVLVEDIGLMVNTRLRFWDKTTAVRKVLPVATRVSALLTVGLLLALSFSACVSSDGPSGTRSGTEGSR